MIRWLLLLFGPRCDAWKCRRRATWETSPAPSWSRGLRWCDDHAEAASFTLYVRPIDWRRRGKPAGEATDGE